MSVTEPFNKLVISTADESGIYFNTEKSLEGHRSVVGSILHFDSPHNKLVSCSEDKTIRIWSSKTYVCLATIEHSVRVRDVVKLNESVFIGCFRDKTIRSFSISSHEQMKEIEFDTNPYQLLKLTEDHFLCHCDEGLFLLSYSRFEIVKKYEMKQFGFPTNPLLLSRKYLNCFYVATNAKHDPIVLIDFEKDKIVKEFTGHETKTRIFALSLFKNSRNEEILIACQKTENMYSYNTSHPKFDTNKKINQEIDSNNVLLKMFDLPGKIYCCCCLNNQYLICGNDNGWVHIYEFSKQNLTLIGKKNVDSFRKGSELRCLKSCLKLIPSKASRSVRMITSTTRGEICVTRVSGLRLKEENSYEQTDLKERFHFLFHEHERIFFDEKEKNWIEIRIENLELELNVPKWILGAKKCI